MEETSAQGAGPPMRSVTDWSRNCWSCRELPRSGKGILSAKTICSFPVCTYDRQGRRQFGAARGIVEGQGVVPGGGGSELGTLGARKTGIRHRQYVLTIGPFSIPLGRSYPRETHQITKRSWQLYLGSAMAPLSWTRLDYEEVEWTAEGIPASEAERTAYELAWESLARQGVERDKILEEKRTVEPLTDADGIRVTVQVEVLEDIGQFLGQ